MDFLYRLLDRLDTWFMVGLLGAVAASFWHKDDLVDRKAWEIFIFSGAVCAHYLTGLISSYFGVVEPRSVAGVGFLLGTFGSKQLISGHSFASGSGEAIHHELRNVERIACGLVALWATWCVLSGKVRDDVLGNIVYSAIAIAISGYVILARNNQFILSPTTASVTLHVSLALAGARHIFMVTY